MAGLRIRLKLVVLHTVFSLLLAGVLWLALRPAVAEIIRKAEAHEAGVVMSMVEARRASGAVDAGGFMPRSGVLGATESGVDVRVGSASAVGLSAGAAAAVKAAAVKAAEGPMFVDDAGGGWALAKFDPADGGTFTAVRVVLAGARDAVGRLYVLLAIALGLVYVMVAAALELFVLPQHVYGPIRTMLRADLALRENRRESELIPAAAIPADELGEIMRSRNESVIALRQHEQDLAEALHRLEQVATDLARKNHLLETAKRNMAESDRLASLGLMSAGIAHELNTPLAVLKGLVEKLHRATGTGSAFKAGGGGTGLAPISTDEAALMLRVVRRLERLSESLLDFARARPSTSAMTPLAPIVAEAWTLVRLDRDAQAVEFTTTVPDELQAFCDADRIVQVLVNLLRNSVDAMAEASSPRRELSVHGELVSTPDGRWAALTITDTGPGIDADLMTRLFEPFVSTRLDAKGTGLGLAVAEGIVREHAGRILARNRSQASLGTSEGQIGRALGGSGGPLPVGGAMFEVLLPVAPPADAAPASVRGLAGAPA